MTIIRTCSWFSNSHNLSTHKITTLSSLTASITAFSLSFFARYSIFTRIRASNPIAATLSLSLGVSISSILVITAAKFLGKEKPGTSFYCLNALGISVSSFVGAYYGYILEEQRGSSS